MKKAKFSIVALGLMATIVAVAVNNIDKVNASKYESLSVVNYETGTPPTNDNVQVDVTDEGQGVVDQNNCTHGTNKEVITKEASCTQNGSKEIRCSICDKVLSKEKIKKTGHNYDENEYCSNCGEYATPKFLGKYEVNGATYQVTMPFSNGWGNVTYIGPTDKSVKKVDIPKEVKINEIKYQVTKIADEAFVGCNALTKVTIGKEVKTIGKSAFENCSKLKDVTIGKGVKDIEKYAFRNCVALKSIDIEKNVQVIDNEAFANCIKLKKVVIGKNVKTISKKAFYNCTSLEKVEMGQSVKTIEKEAFYNCYKLEKIEIKSTVLKKIGENAFAGIASDAMITLDKEFCETLSTLFTAETGFKDTMKIEAKKSIWDYFNQDGDGNVEVDSDSDNIDDEVEKNAAEDALRDALQQ